MPFFFWIAWRFLGARVRQTALTLTGVAMGVTIVAIMQSYIGGFLNYFISRALQSTPYVTVTATTRGLPNPAAPVARSFQSFGNPLFAVNQLPVPDEDEEIKNPRAAGDAVARIPGVQAIAPFISGQGLILNGDLRQGVNFLGVEPLREAVVTGFQQQLIAGTPRDLATRANGAILGKTLAEDLSVLPGDRITLISQEGVVRRLLVVGLYSAQLRDVDRTRVYVNLRTAQQLMQIRTVSGIAIRTATLNDAPRVARAIQDRTIYTARTWREINSGFLDLFTTISMIIYLVVGLTMLVAGFGIANTLILTVSEKTRDIGILKALGAPPRQIALIFFVTGALVGFTGVAIGELLGWAGITAMAHTPIPIQNATRAPVEITYFPMLQIPRVYLLSGGFGLAISMIASVLPSLRASKADPLPVIRGAE
jgi:lipoprotein-releasing system permease protein